MTAAIVSMMKAPFQSSCLRAVRGISHVNKDEKESIEATLRVDAIS
jgi:hypothetical protein